MILPDTDGFELSCQLRAIPYVKDIPIIALTGFFTKFDNPDLMSHSHFTAFLFKPVENTLLLQAIQSYLPQVNLLPFNILKIDQSFINDLSITNNTIAIVQAIIALGRNLGLTIIAEGVETNEQLSILREIKCDLIQGYIFSKPITENELGTLLLKNALQPNI